MLRSKSHRATAIATTRVRRCDAVPSRNFIRFACSIVGESDPEDNSRARLQNRAVHGVGSRNKLQTSKIGLYPSDSMLDVLGRAICSVGCLPRKELHEAWEMAVRVREHFRGGRVVDLCASFGVLAQVMLLLDDTASEAFAVDVRIAPNHSKVNAAITHAFPSLRDRVRFVQGRLESVALRADDVVVSSHACGSLTDDVL